MKDMQVFEVFVSKRSITFTAMNQ